MPDDLEDRLDDVAAGPASMAGEQGSVTEQRLPDLIELDRYNRGKTAAASSDGLLNSALRFARTRPPGTV